MKLPPLPPIGSKLWQPNGRLYHVRAHVDGRFVVRTYSPRRQGWVYAVEDVTALIAGLYKAKRPKNPPPRTW